MYIAFYDNRIILQMFNNISSTITMLNYFKDYLAIVLSEIQICNKILCLSVAAQCLINIQLIYLSSKILILSNIIIFI